MTNEQALLTIADALEAAAKIARRAVAAADSAEHAEAAGGGRTDAESGEEGTPAARAEAGAGTGAATARVAGRTVYPRGPGTPGRQTRSRLTPDAHGTGGTRASRTGRDQ